MNSLAAPPLESSSTPLRRVARGCDARARRFRLARHALQHRHDPARVHAPVDRVLARLDDRGEIFVLRRRSSRARDRASTRRGGARGARSRVETPSTRARDDATDAARRRVRDSIDARHSTSTRGARARAAMDDGEIVGQIGEGAFGRVMLARTTAGARRARGDG